MLIVEDQAYMRRTLRRFLQSAFPDKEVRSAGSGATALALCRDHCPSVVLMDVELPDANGIDLAAQILQLLPGAAVIIVSDHSSAEHVRRAVAAGAAAYVTKDAVEKELIASIKAVLARQQAAPHSQGRS